MGALQVLFWLDQTTSSMTLNLLLKNGANRLDHHYQRWLSHTLMWTHLCSFKQQWLLFTLDFFWVSVEMRESYESGDLRLLNIIKCQIGSNVAVGHLLSEALGLIILLCYCLQLHNQSHVIIHLSGKMGNDDVFPMIDSRLTHGGAVTTMTFHPKKSWIMSACQMCSTHVDQSRALLHSHQNMATKHPEWWTISDF